MDAVPPGGLGGTFGGNPVACAAALAILDSLEELRPQADQLGERLRERLEAMAPAGSDVRALGPMVAIELPEQTPRGDVADHHRGARAGSAAALVRHLRERDPHPRAVHDRRRRSREGARHPGTLPWRLRSRVEGIRKSYGDVVAVDDVDLTSAPASSSRCSARPAPARRRRCAMIAGFEQPDAGTRLARRRGHHARSRPTRAT